MLSDGVTAEPNDPPLSGWHIKVRLMVSLSMHTLPSLKYAGVKAAVLGERLESGFRALCSFKVLAHRV
jgi:hypothetical protein